MTRVWTLAFLACALASCIGVPADISVMTFNIRYDNPRDGIDAWPNRALWVAEVIRASDVDAIGLQEALKHQVDTLAALLPEFEWVGVGRDDGHSRGEFAPVFFDPQVLRLDSWDTVWLSERPFLAGSVGWDAALPRIATRANFVVIATGAAFQFVNVHMDHRGVLARERSAAMLADSVSAKTIAVVVGDFNFVDSTSAYRAALRHGLTDSFVSAQRPNPAPTFTGFDATAAPGARIDYVFVHGASVLSYTALDEQRDGRYVSDHRPVVATLRLRN